MDLNSLYFRHQISLIRAAASGSRALRATHVAAAEGLAGTIACLQLRLGASASTGWAAIADPAADFSQCECAA